MSAAPILVGLFNGAWQGLALSTIAYLIFRRVQRVNATTMFAVWSAILAVCVVLPIVNCFVAVNAPPVVATTAVHHAFSAPPVHPSRSNVSRERVDAASPAGEPLSAIVAERAVAIAQSILANAQMILWIAIVIAMIKLILLVRDVVAMMTARRRVEPIASPVEVPGSVRRRVRFATSREFSSPCMLGFAPVLIVLPDPSTPLRVTPDSLRVTPDPLRVTPDSLGVTRDLLSVVYHELEHVRRYDDVQVLAGRLVGALFFFAPGVIVALRQLALYRERICDDAAIAQSGDAVSYAATLADMAQAAHANPVPVPCLIFRRKQLLQRLHVLLDRRQEHALTIDRRFVLTASMLLILTAALVLRVQVPVFAASSGHEVHISDRGTDDARVYAGTFAILRCPEVANSVELKLEYHYDAPNNHDSDIVGGCVPITEFRGLTLNDLSLPQHHQTFEIVRDAGTMKAAGQVGGPRSWGTWTFVPNPSFAEELSRRGIAAPNAQEQFQMMIDDFHLATLDLLRQRGFAPPTTRELTEMSDAGLSDEFIEAALTLPINPRTVREIIQAAEVGVNRSFIASIEGLGYHPSLEDLVRLREEGIDARWIEGLPRHNGLYSVTDLVRLHEQGY